MNDTDGLDEGRLEGHRKLAQAIISAAVRDIKDPYFWKKQLWKVEHTRDPELVWQECVEYFEGIDFRDHCDLLNIDPELILSRIEAELRVPPHEREALCNE